MMRVRAFAGLRYALDLQPDIVKLDLALGRRIDTDPSRQALVSSLCDFSARTSTLLVAEGIASAEEFATLRELGVAIGPGYLLGRPTRLADLPRKADVGPAAA